MNKEKVIGISNRLNSIVDEANRYPNGNPGHITWSKAVYAIECLSKEVNSKHKKSIIKVDTKLTESIDSLFKYREFLIDKGISEQKIAIALSSMTSLSMDFGVVRLKNGFEVEK